MSRPILATALLASLVTGCSSSNGAPVAPVAADSSGGTSSSAALPVGSAVRAPAALLQQQEGPGRRRDLTGAVPYSTAASAYPISALAYSGTTPAQTNPACPQAANQFYGAYCKADINVSDAVVTQTHPSAYSLPGVQPGLLHMIYGLSSSLGSKKAVVALVVAYDDPGAAADLAVYRSEFGLAACTAANGCFKKIAGTGTALPAPNANWSVETSLDLDAVSALCSSCSILLVEAASNQIPDLAAAVDTAVANGATVVSNSYGVAEASDNVGYASHYVHAGVPIVAAAGDLGYGAQFPASVPQVVSVGGTSVEQIGGGAIQEIVWPNTGSGCSAFFAKPAWQKDTLCPGRTLNDVSMLADPTEGISVYDSTIPGTTAGGWFVVGGTSLASPLVATLFAMAESGGVVGGNAALYAAAKAQSVLSPALLDITKGSNGTCAPVGLCTAETGYDGPSGNGVPWGVTAFAPAGS